MKKMITLLVLVLGVVTANAWDNPGGRFGMALTQNPNADEAKNFGNKDDYVRLILEGKGFPMAPGTMYPGLTQEMYNKYLPIMHKAHNSGFRAQLQSINEMTKGQLVKDFGFKSSVFTDEMCAEIFKSSAVFADYVPQNEEVTWDAYDVNDMKPFSITRGFHYIGKNKTPEMGWWLKITGYEPILIKSQYCNNNTGTDWIKRHLVQTSTEDEPLPSDEDKGNLLPKDLGPKNRTGGNCLNVSLQPTNQVGGICVETGGLQNINATNGPQNISNGKITDNGPKNVSNISSQKRVEIEEVKTQPGPTISDYQF
jgi:hypothetical protein